MDSWTSLPHMRRAVAGAVLKIAGVLILLALLGRDLGSALGFAIGASLSLWQFNHLANSVIKVLQKPKAQAQISAASNSVLRYLVVAGFLTLIFFTPAINFYAAFVGLLLVKLVIIGTALRQALRQGGVAYLKQLADRRRRKERE